MLCVNDVLGIVNETNNLTAQTLSDLLSILETAQHLDPSNGIAYAHDIGRIIRLSKDSIDRCNILCDEVASIYADAYDAVYDKH